MEGKIDELKRALVEVKKLCINTICRKCPLGKVDEKSGVPYCPLCEDEYGMEIQMPDEWAIDDWEEDAYETL